MTDPRHLSINDFTYHLPDERIARYPLTRRDASRLLIYDEGIIREDIYRNIANHIPGGSLFVFNDTKVVEARLLFQKPTGGILEVFCLEPHEKYGDITLAMRQQDSVLWKCLVGGASKWKHGQVPEKRISGPGGDYLLKAKIVDRASDYFILELSWNRAHLSFAEMLHQAGAIPLPPYLKRVAEKEDADRYQTIYAGQDGSVAAPTAGLHFTQEIFQSLEEKNIHRDFITLHVGAGTFKPVKSERMKDHEMHAEYFTVTAAFIKKLLDHLPEKIIAAGTTSLRTLESLYWLGVKMKKEDETGTKTISQWEAYDADSQLISPRESLSNLLAHLQTNKLTSLTANTRIILAPGYRFRIVNGLVTNFHQPQSTLLLLVAAAIGAQWKNVYSYALDHDFRFLSYGDGSLLWIHQA
jgi:S-adenosylmethionine:tRNA ribosyltransferase-isomerase